MSTYHVKFIREFSVQMDADSLAECEKKVEAFLKEFPSGSTRKLSITVDGHVDAAEDSAANGPPDPTDIRNAGLARKVKEELAKPRYPGGIDDLIA